MTRIDRGDISDIGDVSRKEKFEVKDEKGNVIGEVEKEKGKKHEAVILPKDNGTVKYYAVATDDKIEYRPEMLYDDKGKEVIEYLPDPIMDTNGEVHIEYIPRRVEDK